MIRIDNYFDKIICINLDKRSDRWIECIESFELFNLKNVIRFPGKIVYINDKPHGNAGCTASHKAILELICQNGWGRTLILEDDFKIIYDDFHEKFDAMIRKVPNDWDMLYLGGHYGEPPIKRINEHVIKHGRMLTTSSYGITYSFAQKIKDFIHGANPIDSIYGQFHSENNCYIFQPRLIIQRESYSDLQEIVSNNGPCMMDTNHENMI